MNNNIMSGTACKQEPSKLSLLMAELEERNIYYSDLLYELKGIKDRLTYSNELKAYVENVPDDLNPLSPYGFVENLVVFNNKFIDNNLNLRQILDNLKEII